ncbi:MAG: hypothetical protein ACXABI_13455 [Candidatus Hodarchaeales archaeon]|jgi:hypothetical protein
MPDLGTFSRKVVLLGVLTMLLFCFMFIIDYLFFDSTWFDGTILGQLNLTLTQSVTNGQGWLWSIFFTVATSLISFYGYNDLKNNPNKYDLVFIWGIFSIVLGVIGGTIGGIILSVAGVFLVIDYFINR